MQKVRVHKTMNTFLFNMLPYFVILIFLCYGIGLFYQTRNDYGKLSIVQSVVFGAITLLALFELIALPCIFFRTSFSFLADLFLKVSAAIFLISILTHIRKIYEAIRFRNWKHDCKNLIFIPVLLLIAFQIYITVCYTHLDDDDAYFVATSVTALETNSLFCFDPYTGVASTVMNTRYIFSPFFLLYGVFSKVMGFPPAVIAHTFFPMILLALTYAVYFMWAEYLFPQKKRYQMLFLVFVCLLNMYGTFSVYASSSFLLFRIWQGKAVLAGTLLPLIILILLSIVQNHSGHYTHKALFITVIASCLSSSMAIPLVPTCIGVFWFISLCIKRKFLASLRLILCISPCLLIGIFYLLDQLKGGLF